jgi:hypothetical protein
MDRNLNQQEQEKVRAARANFFQIQKRKNPTTGDSCLEDATETSNTQPDNMSLSKRFKFPGMTSTKPSATASKTPLIVRFYDADVQAKDAHGRTQELILAWPDTQLESCHNYIQMLFPVPEGSAFNWEAPIIDREVMDTFRARSDLRNRLRRSFERMLEFYGFEYASQSEDTGENEVTQADDKSKDTAASSEHDATQATKSRESAIDNSAVSLGTSVVRAPHWRNSFRNWAVRFDHNHLRITRILRCLRVLGLQKECDAFFEALKNVFDDPSINISERTMTYWTRAVTRPLYIAPDDDEIEWLKEWEEEQQAAQRVDDVVAKEETEGKDE